MLVACALAGCAHADVASLVTSELSLACDWGQTRSAASADWSGNRQENNPLMGMHPSTVQVDMYFGVAALLDATLWLALPKGWRSVAPIGVTALEADIIYGNRDTTTSKCGLWR